jgi:hypothetical protein
VGSESCGRCPVCPGLSGFPSYPKGNLKTDTMCRSWIVGSQRTSAPTGKGSGNRRHLLPSSSGASQPSHLHSVSRWPSVSPQSKSLELPSVIKWAVLPTIRVLVPPRKDAGDGVAANDTCIQCHSQGQPLSNPTPSRGNITTGRSATVLG